VFLGISVAGVWFSQNLAVQWVFVEGSTLTGALLLSMNRFKKTLDTAWKFLLINSLGLAFAFLGLILLVYGMGGDISLDQNAILDKFLETRSFTSEIGIWLMIFGYSTKLGLFPNHFWVEDTYSESPSHVAAGLAALLPSVACFPLYNLIEIEEKLYQSTINPMNGLCLFGVLTILYCVFAVWQVKDIRRIAALTALFHNGAIAIYLAQFPSKELFLYFIATILLLKTALFFSVRALKVDRAHTDLSDIVESGQISKASLWVFALVLFSAFVFPISPVFVSDLLFIQDVVLENRAFLILLPMIGAIFFVSSFSMLVPLFHLRNKKDSSIETGMSWVFWLCSIALALFGYWKWPIGGFFHVI
jgi:hydrogenase-4 component F